MADRRLAAPPSMQRTPSTPNVSAGAFGFSLSKDDLPCSPRATDNFSHLTQIIPACCAGLAHVPAAHLKRSLQASGTVNEADWFGAVLIIMSARNNHGTGGR